jgi:hypothetical protein
MPLVFEGDGEMSRIGIDHGGLRHRRHHAPAHARLSQLAQLALDSRIARGLPELLLQLARRDFVRLEPLPVLEQVVGGGDDREDRHHSAEHVHGERARERQDQRRIGADEASEAVALRPQQGRHHRADDRELGETLAKFASACRPSVRSGFAERRLEEGKAVRIERRHRFVVHLVAGKLEHFILVAHGVAARAHFVVAIAILGDPGTAHPAIWPASVRARLIAALEIGRREVAAR